MFDSNNAPAFQPPIQMSGESSTLRKRACICSTHFKMFPQSVKATKTIRMARDRGISRKSIKASILLFNDWRSRLNSIKNRANEAHYRYGLPWGDEAGMRSTVRLIPKGHGIELNLEAWKKDMLDWKLRWDQEVAEGIAKREEYIAKDRLLLGYEFDERLYPSPEDLKRLCAFEMRITEVPDLTTIQDELLGESALLELNKARQMLAVNFDSAKLMLGEIVSEYMEDVVDRLKNFDNTKELTIKRAQVRKWQRFANELESMDLWDIPEVARFVEIIRTKLTDDGKLREDSNHRRRVEKAVIQLKNDIELIDGLF